MNAQLLNTLTWLIPALPIAAFFIIAWPRSGEEDSQ